MIINNVNAWDFIAKMEDNSVDAIITDPLYDTDLNMPELKRICKGNIIMFCDPKKRFFAPDEIAYWIKTPSTKNYSKHIGRFVEMILILRRGDTFNAGLHWSNYIGVYDDKLLTKPVHPYEKPLSLMERLISIYTNKGDIVFDPFAGSGTTLKAAINLDRKPLGCEIDHKYYELALKNIFPDKNKICLDAGGDGGAGELIVIAPDPEQLFLSLPLDKD